ncbi:MAG: SDR family NAD(P)-dependent oxidoreductase [Promethearchaeota archaeon]|jgi:NAD(P)-dependent dehydrogenase (short-subunit alcohol dehydrogenase family)
MGKLDNKVCIITGAAGGIGRATSRLFVEEGAKGVIMVDIWDEMGEKTANDLGPNTIYLHADVAQESDIKASIDLAIEKFGKLDIIFSNAGNPGPGGGIQDISTNDFDNTIAIHLRAAFLYMKYAIPIMKKQGSGNFISTSSVAGYQQGMGSFPYSLAKAGLIHFTRIAAVELGIFGIRANSIAPGGIATGIFGQGMGLSREDAEKWAELRKEGMAEGQPLRQAGLPIDIAKAALFLASDASSFITGETILVDGGLLSGRIPYDQEESMERFYRNLRTLNPEDQKRIMTGIELGSKRALDELQYIKPEIREKVMKRMQKLEKTREKILKKLQKK